jgi:acid phosphatase type 7
VPRAALGANRRSYAFRGLSCGTSYRLAVQATDAAQNVSRRRALVAATSDCPPGDPVIAAAGDLCSTAGDCAATAALLDRIDPDRVLTLGDNAYEDGSVSEFTRYYDPNWGRFKARTSPSPGNHDYHTSGTRGYFDYFGERAPGEYYSFGLGASHVISLNSEISGSSGSPQDRWLQADLAAHPNRCILAYWHKPRFSSGRVHGSSSSMANLWRRLEAARADIVLVSHEHNYERFARQTADGAADPQGIRQFVVGTGGSDLSQFGRPIANSEVRNGSTHGVLEIVLHPAGYDWRFVPVAGASFTDSGSGSC